MLRVWSSADCLRLSPQPIHYHSDVALAQQPAVFEPCVWWHGHKLGPKPSFLPIDGEAAVRIGTTRSRRSVANYLASPIGESQGRMNGQSSITTGGWHMPCRPAVLMTI